MRPHPPHIEESEIQKWNEDRLVSRVTHAVLFAALKSSFLSRHRTELMTERTLQQVLIDVADLSGGGA